MCFVIKWTLASAHTQVDVFSTNITTCKLLQFHVKRLMELIDLYVKTCLR